MGPNFDPIWELLPSADRREVADCWDLSLAVLRQIIPEEPEISLHDILESLEGQSGESDDGFPRSQKASYLYIAIFGVLCWSSLVMRPKLTFSDAVAPNFACMPPYGFKPTNNPTSFRIKDRCMRPILTTFRPFKQQHWGDRSDEHIHRETRETDSLYEASLNFYSLRYFGYVTIQWVDTISEHLRFNPANRRLSLFRFPTFCALLAIHGDNICWAIPGYDAHQDADPY